MERNKIDCIQIGDELYGEKEIKKLLQERKELIEEIEKLNRLVDGFKVVVKSKAKRGTL